MPRLSNVLVTLVAVSTVSALCYALYFDYKRRNDPELRRKILKEKRKDAATKLVDSSEKIDILDDLIDVGAELLSIPLEEVFQRPPHEREQYFVQLLVKGEELLVFGEKYVNEAVALFYRAMRLLPNPTELLINLQKVLPDPVFNALVLLVTEEGTKKIVEYFESLPPKNAEVEVKTAKLTTLSGQEEQTWSAFAKTDFEQGETIYTEIPDISTSIQLIDSESYCGHCIRKLDSEDSIKLCLKCQEKYCSEDCLNSAQSTYHPFLCTIEDPKEPSAYQKLVRHCKETGTYYGPLVAKYLALLFSEESRVSTDKMASNPFVHFEFLRPLVLPSSNNDKKEAELVRQLFSQSGTNTGSNAAEHLTDTRYMSVKGTLIFNCIGIPKDIVDSSSDVTSRIASKETFKVEDTNNMSSSEEIGEHNSHLPQHSGSLMNAEQNGEPSSEKVVKMESPATSNVSSFLDLDPSAMMSPETSSGISTRRHFEVIRSDIPESLLKGFGLYHFSCHLQHSCEPNVKIVSTDGSHRIGIVALRTIKAGEELFISYIPKNLSSTSDRRALLKETFHFDCHCSSCQNLQ